MSDNEETVKLKVNVSLITSVRSNTESVIDTGETREDWDAMTKAEQEKLGNELYSEWVATMTSGGWEVVED
ncbi:hypothetical protein FXF51_05915 [Nonomuraea sp. PA05]|uniref:DUF7167 family protein n=1 Tax=Nonomuraea sp. PA05 TaxID=2604466 RepID=UPI0011D927BE|nr:hypothetical protein [Nonomuraea sp. PA05]TYB69696.1 hypothetical protein FXF51_05915 [Nonomuraea sp. PA05]